MQNPLLVAVDTNFPLLLAERDAHAVDALEVVRTRVRPAQVLVPPTALDELVFKANRDPEPEMRELARRALQQLRPGWKFHPASLNSLQEALVAGAVGRLRHSGILPFEERNDAAIIAESAVLNCILLVSNDSHLLEVDHRRLSLLFREIDLPVPVLVSPREIVRKFYR